MTRFPGKPQSYHSTEKMSISNQDSQVTPCGQDLWRPGEEGVCLVNHDLGGGAVPWPDSSIFLNPLPTLDH